MKSNTSENFIIPSFVKSRPKTKIVCTLGPSTKSISSIKKLIKSGMSVARINLSHGNIKDHTNLIKNARTASKEMNFPLAILADIPGPKYRINIIDSQDLDLQNGSTLDLYNYKITKNNKHHNIWPSGFIENLKIGSKLIVDDGSIELKLEVKNKESIICKVTSGGILKNNKSITAPGNSSDINYFSKETLEAIDFVKSSDVDYIGLSFIRNSSDLMNIKDKLVGIKNPPKLISKIEIEQAIKNIDEIITNSDGVMVARGDLGVEMPFEKVPEVQKRIIKLSNKYGKPVITATQMLESMIDKPNPTRAEVTDIHNAVIDGTDAVMLSGETSVGKNPIKAVKAMAKIAKTSEKYLDTNNIANRRDKFIHQKNNLDIDHAIALSSCNLSNSIQSKAVFAFTESGSTASRVASFRPKAPIIALCSSYEVCINLCLNWGIIPIKVKNFSRVQDMFREGSKIAIETKLAKANDSIVVVLGLPIGQPGNTNLLRVIVVPEIDNKINFGYGAF
ncbi:MAG: pyruvate kinase [Chloroflexi bacterium]|nr:pyruvate kinase [Chloroflexota bacterium]